MKSKIWEILVYRGQNIPPHKLGEVRTNISEPEILVFSMLKTRHGFYLRLK